ncbi:transporter substrate-binding domain-containing protein [Saccharopolyspora sp. NPDC049426]|uniref:transporter substrate-binding domain-containing protein n=1 Tax=Saccharopolyspora sp. NPDC049426 TaxID=3155652 RepID=UPI00343E4218
MRLIAAVLSAALLTLGATACGSGTGAAPANCTPKVPDDQLVKPGTLTYATNATLPPMQYVEGDEVVGMRIDLANELAKRLCLRTEVVNVPFDAQVPGVQGHRWDLINTGMFYTPPRAETMNLVPYEVQAVGVAVAAGNPKQIKSREDLSGRTLAVEAPGYEFDTLNLLNEQFIAQGKAPIQLRTFQTNADAFQALSAGQVDGASIVESVMSFYQQGGRFETVVRGMNRAPLALGFAKDRRPVADAVAAELAAMRAEGWMKSLFDEYGVSGFDGELAVTTGPLPVQQ